MSLIEPLVSDPELAELPKNDIIPGEIFEKNKTVSKSNE